MLSVSLLVEIKACEEQVSSELQAMGLHWGQPPTLRLLCHGLSGTTMPPFQCPAPGLGVQGSKTQFLLLHNSIQWAGQESTLSQTLRG